MTAPQLNTVQVDQALATLRALVEHRDDLDRARTQTVNRLHALLTQLLPAGVPTGLTAKSAAELPNSVRPRAPLQRILRRLAADLIAEIRRLDRRIGTASEDVAATVTEAACTLAELYGAGTLLAGTILARARASWQLPGPDSHRQAMTSLRPEINYTVHLQSAGRTKARG